MDAKGRVAIPGSFRDVITSIGSDDMVVTVDPLLPHLSLYPVSIWNQVQAKIAALSSTNPYTAKLRHTFVGNAFDRSVDSGNRVLLPQVLRDHAGLSKELMLVGAINKIEIWAGDNWAARETEIDLSNVPHDQLPEELQTISY